MNRIFQVICFILDDVLYHLYRFIQKICLASLDKMKKARKLFFEQLYRSIHFYIMPSLCEHEYCCISARALSRPQDCLYCHQRTQTSYSPNVRDV